MDAQGSNPVRLTDEADIAAPQCSPDGEWVLYMRGYSALRLPIIGGVPDPVGSSNSWGVRVSPNGKFIANVAWWYGSSKPLRIQILPFGGGAALYEFDWPGIAGEPRWKPDSRAIQYVLTRDGVSNIWEHGFTDSAPKQVTNFKSDMIFDFDWSRDGKRLALTRGSTKTDLVTISNFR